MLARALSRARGVVTVYWHFNSVMPAAIVVFDRPIYAAPAADGSFVLADIPGGHYELAAWHERIGENKFTIDVTPGGIAKIRFVLPSDA